ncbi:C2 domain containing protein [Histomonas meleagridis]|uniref:C2 domain containing protein n=1 Tax=Histomonas meleagridis TaxID=135588 RepID=UPI00355A8438|nr:C2 domain containing protein [Histomonas meleagridis]KAH0798959.1 C2 domain containing protein [Histomonas meleagridis]
MLEIYISSASNLPSADLNGYSDPYTMLWSTTWGGEVYYTKTKTIKKTLDPEWDPDYIQPLKIPFVCANSLLLKIFDKDVAADDYLGCVKLDLNYKNCKKNLTLPVDVGDNKTKGPPTITLRYCNPTTNFPTDPSHKDYNVIYSYLTYQTPVSSEHAPASLVAYIVDMTADKTISCYPLNINQNWCSSPNDDSFLGPTGLTNVIRIHLDKLNRQFNSKEVMVFFYIKSNDYYGDTTLNLLGSPSPKFEVMRSIKTMKKPEKFKIILTSELKLIQNQITFFPIYFHYKNKNVSFDTINFQLESFQSIEAAVQKVTSNI